MQFLHSWLGLEDLFGLLVTPFPASRKRYLRRRAALGQLSTILLAARPVLWRRQRRQVKRLGGAAAWAAPGRSQAALVAKLPSPDSVHPPSPTAQGPRSREIVAGWALPTSLCLTRADWGLQEVIAFLYPCPFPGPPLLSAWGAFSSPPALPWGPPSLFSSLMTPIGGP